MRFGTNVFPNSLRVILFTSLSSSTPSAARWTALVSHTCSGWKSANSSGYRYRLKKALPILATWRRGLWGMCNAHMISGHDFPMRLKSNAVDMDQQRWRHSIIKDGFFSLKIVYWQFIATIYTGLAPFSHNWNSEDIRLTLFWQAGNLTWAAGSSSGKTCFADTTKRPSAVHTVGIAVAIMRVLRTLVDIWGKEEKTTRKGDRSHIALFKNGLSLKSVGTQEQPQVVLDLVLIIDQKDVAISFKSKKKLEQKVPEHPNQTEPPVFSSIT